MKTIICFTDNLGSGGAQRQLVGLACLLKEQGYDVSVLLYYDNPFYKPTLDKVGIESVVIGNTANPIKRLWKLYRYLKKQPCDAMIAYQETPSLIASLFRPLFKWHKLIVSERNTTQKLTIKDQLRFWAYRFADTIVPNSYSQASFLKDNYHQLSSKIVPITNFVDTDIFTPSTNHRRGRKLVVVASHKPEKNFNIFIEAVSLLKSRGVMLEIEWYGIRDAMLSQHRKIIENSGVSDIVRVFSAHNNIQEVYQSADYFCLPSLFEGFPNVLCEAMSCGLSVICSNVCDNPYIVENGDNGYLFDPYNATDMADAIERLLAISNEEYSAMSIKNRERSISLFSKNTFVGKYIELLK